jgi:hypothetical protein
MTSRSRSWSVRLSASARLPVRSMISRRKRSISSRAVVEGLVEPLAGFELLAVDQQGVGPGQRIAVLVEVAKQRQAALHELRSPSWCGRWKPEM